MTVAIPCLSMTWTLLRIAEIGSDGDGLLYPVPSGATNGVIHDSADGSCAPPVSFTTIELKEHFPGGGTETLLKASEIKGSLHITDSRLVVACSKYDKGGGWVGGVSSLAFDAVSKARAALRSRGTSLVGHIRYPWLASAGYIRKTGWLSDEVVRFVSYEKAGSEEIVYLLDLKLPKTTSAQKVAREVTQRAALYRLDHTKVEDDDHPDIEALLHPPALPERKNRFSAWKFTTSFYPRASTAFGDLGKGSTIEQPADK